MQIGEALLCVCGTVCTTDPLDKEQNVYITIVQSLLPGLGQAIMNLYNTASKG